MMLLTAASLFADDWVLAAEAFSGDETAGTLMPSLILDSIPEHLVRTVTDEEQTFRRLLVVEKDVQSHQAALDKLIRERDTVIFTTEDIQQRRDKIADYEKKIAEERASLKLAEDESALLEEGGVTFEKLEENVVLWKNSAGTLYKRGNSGDPSDIRALISGSVQERNGYLYVKAALTVYPGAVACKELVAAGTLSDAATIAEELASALVDQIVNAVPVSLVFSISPAEAARNAEVTVDGAKIMNPEVYHAFQSGIHTVTIEAPGFEKQTFTRDFSDASRYQIDAVLPAVNPVNLNLAVFSTDGTPADNAQVWIAGKNAGIAPVSVSVNGRQIFGVVQGTDGVSSYFTISASGESIRTAVTLQNETSQSRIEKSRKSLYTSYGLLLLSLPFTFYFYGRMTDAYNAYTYGSQATTTADDFYKWQKIERVSMCVSVGFGVNMIYRLVRYVMDADSVLPEEAEPEKEEI